MTKKNLKKIGYIIYFEAFVNRKEVKVFVAEFDTNEDAEVNKSKINRANGNIDVAVGVAHHYSCPNSEDNDYIDIVPKNSQSESDHFKYTDMICADHVVKVCDSIVGERERRITI